MIVLPDSVGQSVDLVVACVDAVWPRVLQAPVHWLAPGEAQRLARIANPVRAREFVASRCFMRMLLSTHAGYDRGWWHWVLDAPDNATPLVRACRIDGAELHLNLSHSEGLLACALSHRPVGVDLEVQRARRWRDLDGLMDMVCSPKERSYLDGLPEAVARQRVFTQLWTLKESYFKWQGTGLDLVRLKTLCSRGEPMVGKADQVHCATGSGDWAGRGYEISLCTGSAQPNVRLVELAGVKIQKISRGLENLMLESMS